MEFIVPKNTKVVFVNDFYTNEVQGGAELTTDVIMNASPHKIFKIHSFKVAAPKVCSLLPIYSS
jgi:hypothetical protein